MRYYSDITGKLYASEKEAIKAEEKKKEQEYRIIKEEYSHRDKLKNLADKLDELREQYSSEIVKAREVLLSKKEPIEMEILKLEILKEKREHKKRLEELSNPIGEQEKSVIDKHLYFWIER